MPFEIEKIEKIPGWLGPEQAEALYRYASEAPAGNILEIGTFCGKSSCIFAQALKDKGVGTLVCLDQFLENKTLKVKS